MKWSIVSDLSRARLETDGRGEFVPGDTIVVSAHNVTSGLVRRYVLHLESDGWKPFVPWSEVGNGEVIFTAWHASPSGRLVNDAGDSESAQSAGFLSICRKEHRASLPDISGSLR